MSLRIGLIVNAMAGLGGSVALRGSDGVVEQALALGATPQATERARDALSALHALGQDTMIITGSGSIGEDAARAAGLPVEVVYRSATPGSAEDTASLARRLVLMQVDLLMFAGGDGTARDVAECVGDAFPVLGIPAGVKMYSGSFATTPAAAGTLAVRYLRSKARRTQQSEVMDLDEEDLRCGRIQPGLFGYVATPEDPRLLQGKKIRSLAAEVVQTRAIAVGVVESMSPEVVYLIGPGSTTWALKQALSGAASLLGVDAYEGGKLLMQDATASQLEELTVDRVARAIVTCIGGQGHIFGRGNQQFSPTVVRRIGRGGVSVLATPTKLVSLAGRPFIADLNDASAAAEMTGHLEVICGYRSKSFYRCEAF
jgi:predicted polyphosphate/ATP-dependent NAD kinase